MGRGSYPRPHDARSGGIDAFARRSKPESSFTLRGGIRSSQAQSRKADVTGTGVAGEAWTPLPRGTIQATSRAFVSPASESSAPIGANARRPAIASAAFSAIIIVGA